MNHIKVLLVGGPRNRETIVMEPRPYVRFSVPSPDSTVSFDPTFSLKDAMELTMTHCTYIIETIRGPNLVRHLGIHEDLDMDGALSLILGSYEK